MRVDSGVAAGTRDPRRLRLDVREADRERRPTASQARRRMLRALDEFHVEGVPTTIPVHRWILESKEFRDGTHTTTWLERALADAELPAAGRPAARRAVAPREGLPADILVEVDGRRVPVRIFDERREVAPQAADAPRRPPRRARPRRDPRADAGHDREGARREGPGDRGGRRGLHPRGDEDGEPHRLDPRRRGHRPPDPRPARSWRPVSCSPSSTERPASRGALRRAAQERRGPPSTYRSGSSTNVM